MKNKLAKDLKEKAMKEEAEASAKLSQTGAQSVRINSPQTDSLCQECELRVGDKMIKKEELRHKMMKMDWIEILSEAINSRPSSWNSDPVREWRNASDEICMAVIHAMEAENLVDPFMLKNKDGKIL